MPDVCEGGGDLTPPLSVNLNLRMTSKLFPKSFEGAWGNFSKSSPKRILRVPVKPKFEGFAAINLPLTMSETWGRDGGVLAVPDVYERGSDLPPPLSVNLNFRMTSKPFPKSFEGAWGNFSKSSPKNAPPFYSVSNGFARRPQSAAVDSWEKQILCLSPSR